MKALKLRLVVAASFVLFAALFYLSMAEPPIFKQEYSNLHLQSFDVSVEVTGNIASTRYTMVLKNKTDRVDEGWLNFSLPAGRAVTYYALDIDGKMREAVAVERERGSQIYTSIVRKRVDPGLLEKLNDNTLYMRVYPVQPFGTRTVEIGYDEELTLENDSLRYRLLVACPDSLEKFSAKATVRNGAHKPIVPDSVVGFRFNKVGESYTASFTDKNFIKVRELNFALPAPADTALVIMQPVQGSYYFLASLAAPKPYSRKKQWEDDLTIIWDVSLSGSQRDIERELKVLDLIFAEKKNANVHLYYLNNTLTKMIPKNTADGKHKVIDGNWDELRNILKRAVFDGGTDFSKINLKAIAGDEIIFFSDGISTLSDSDFIKDNAVNIKRPIHCVVSSAKADSNVMKSIAYKTKGKYLNLNTLSSKEQEKELLNEKLRFFGTKHGKAVRETYTTIAPHGNVSVAGISDTNNAELTLLFGFGNKIEKRVTIPLDMKTACNSAKAQKFWAQREIAKLDLSCQKNLAEIMELRQQSGIVTRKRIAELDSIYQKNLAEIMELGQQFSIVTRNTSLIVLETVDDYVRYNITPPTTETELYSAYLRKTKQQTWQQNKAQVPPQSNTPPAPPQSNAPPMPSQSNTRPAVKNESTANTAASTQTQPKTSKAKSTASKSMAFEAAEVVGYCDNPTPIYIVDIYDPNADPIVLDRSFKENIKEIGLDILGSDGGPVNCRVSKSYMSKLTGNTDEDYKQYLKLRKDNVSSPEFYFDFADWFYTHGDKKRALRVLTSVADLALQYSAPYQTLGYRLKEYGEYAPGAFICQQILKWWPYLRYHRDYALALADNGNAQAALDSLYSSIALIKEYYRYSGVAQSTGEVVVTEINRLIAKNANLNTSKIDSTLIRDVHADIRVVINWNTDYANINLHIIDPNGEICDRKHNKTKIGGYMIGHAPEQFILKNAIKGKYQVYVNHRTNRIDAEPITIMAEIYTKYAGKEEQRRIVCLKLSNATGRDCGMVEVTTIDID
jgi:tetratricopeptide (TPR) repeat protein